MARGRSSSWHIAKIFKEITWDAGLVVRSAFRGLHKPRRKKPTEYVRFLYKGQFYRRPISKKKKPPKLMKLPPAGPQVFPQAFRTPPSKVASQKADAIAATKPTHGGGSKQSTWSWRAWWKLNAPLIILNFGSMATLVGFTRSDVLELRALSMTGNTMFVVYSLLQPPPIRWAAVCWSCLFASVNGYNIARIMTERKGKVYLAPHEEEIYHEHFQPHGVTPKQFEKIMSNGKTRIIKKGDVVSRQGDQASSVKLIVRGDTRANVMGRHVTAMGSIRGNRDSLQGGDSGAWVGEMAFLQSMWDRDHAPKPLQKKLSTEKPSDSVTATKTGSSASAEGVILRSGLPRSDEPYKYRLISTIVALEDIEVVEWSFEDMEKVMKSSRDIEGSLTRAMTAAIVGKVANFMVSRQSAIPKWSTLLDNWKHASPRHGRGEDDKSDDDEEEAEDEEQEERTLLQSFQRHTLR
ncbi:hypothetical protein ACHAWF_009661 [Thalassiosira exigua]